MTKAQYAYYCIQLIEGEDYMLEDLFKALREDGFTDESDEWVYGDVF